MSEGVERHLASGARGVPPSYLSVASFVAALRRADRTALGLAYAWYVPLLSRHARVLGVSPDECDDMATTVLGDVLLHLLRADLPPRDFVRYLISALRNGARSEHRDRRRLLATQEHAYRRHGDGRERIVAECHSEYALRASHGEPAVNESPGGDDGPQAARRSAVARLAERSAQALTESEAALAVGVSHHVPLRELAEQAGISHANARVRMHRLRVRMHKLALEQAPLLDDAERREIRRFLRRAGLMLATDAETGARPSSCRDAATREGSDDAP